MKVPVLVLDAPCIIALVIADDCGLDPALCVEVPQAVKAAAPASSVAPASLLNRIWMSLLDRLY